MEMEETVEGSAQFGEYVMSRYYHDNQEKEI
jgi:hypothetical protein